MVCGSKDGGESVVCRGWQLGGRVGGLAAQHNSNRLWKPREGATAGPAFVLDWSLELDANARHGLSDTFRG